VRRLVRALALLPLVALLGAAPRHAPRATPQPPAAPAAAPYQPPEHSIASPLFSVLSPQQAARAADDGVQMELGRPPGWALAEHRKLDRALGTLLPQRRGVIDAYVVAVALDSDPVFGREAREAARVLSRRYDAAGRTIVLAGSDGSAPSASPQGSPETLSAALARVAELIDKREDALILYTTSHGAPLGIVYNDGDQGFGAISPARLADMLGQLGFRRRVIIVSACFSGLFISPLAGEDTAILTASAGDRTSFGCQANADWTFFGDALINHALRKAQPLDAAAAEARALVEAWEARGRLTPSLPRTLIGAGAARWLAQLDKRTPRVATQPVGLPAVTLLDK